LIVTRPPETSRLVWPSTLTGYSVNDRLAPPTKALAPIPAPTAALAVTPLSLSASEPGSADGVLELYSSHK
jgi:hypothetical protein